MLKTLLIKFIAIIIATSLLLFIEYKFEVVDYLRFVNSVKSLEGRSIAYSSNGELIAVGKKFTDSKTIEIRQAKSGSLITSLDASVANQLAFSPDNSMIAAGSYDGQVRVWRIIDGQLLDSFDLKTDSRDSRMNFLSFAEDEQNIVMLTSGLLNIRNLTSKTNRILRGDFTSVALSSDKKILALGNGNNKTLDLYRLEDLSSIKQLEVNQIPLFTLSFSPNGKQIAFVSRSFLSSVNRNSYNIYLHSVEDGSLENIFFDSIDFPAKEKESLKDMAISPDGRYLAASYSRSVPSSFFVGAPRGSDARFYGRIRVWRIEDGKQLSTFRGHQPKTYGITFSPDGKFLASTGGDGKVRFWKMPPRNYSWLWLFCTAGLAVLLYWRRTELISLINRY